MRPAIRKCLTAVGIAAAVSIPAVASHADGIKWTGRPAPSYCYKVRGIEQDPPPYGQCVDGIWVHGPAPWWMIRW